MAEYEELQKRKEEPSLGADTAEADTGGAHIPVNGDQQCLLTSLPLLLAVTKWVCDVPCRCHRG